MKKILFSSLLLFLVLTGCNDEAYNNAIQKGLDYIASEDYQKAEGAFELALDEKSDDEKATALLKQTIAYQEAQEALDEGELELALKKAKNVTKETEGSDALLKKAEKLLSSVEELQTTLTELTKKYESAKKQFKEEEYDKASKAIDKLLKDDLSQPIYQAVKKDAEKLRKDIKAAISAKEKAEKERAAQEEAERAAAEQANEQQEAEVESGTSNLTPDDAMAIIKGLTDWPSTSRFHGADTYELDGVKYYNIYVDDAVDESYASKINYLVDANDGRVYDFSRGELIPLD